MTKIFVKKLRKHIDPYVVNDIWETGENLDRALISKCINAGALGGDVSWSSLKSGKAQETYSHNLRVAWLVLNQDKTPIELDVGVPSLGYYRDWLIVDGYHRFAAAIYRGDKEIYADISGEISYAEELFGVKI